MVATNIHNSNNVAKHSRLRRGARSVKRHHKKAALIPLSIIVAACTLSVAAQIAYPPNRALPGTRLAGTVVSFNNSTAIKQTLAKLNQKPLVLKLGSDNYRVTPSEAGLSFASDQNVTKVLRYPLSQRLIPFSMFFQNKAFVQKSLAVSVNKSSLQKFATMIVNESNTKPVEGVITIQNGQVSEHPPQPGAQFTVNTIMTTLESLTGNLPPSLTIAGRPVLPAYDTTAVHTAAIQATGLTQPFTLHTNGTTYTIPATIVGSWLTFTPNPTTKAIDIGFDTAAIRDYLSSIAKQVYRSPTTTTVTLLDNKAASQQTGTQGAYLDTSAATSAIATALGQKATAATVSLASIVSPISYIHTYSATSAGMQALLNDWVVAHGDVTWGISIAELGGKNRSAGYNAGTSFMPASIYKLYVSYAAQSEISAGALDPNTITSTGQSVATCLDVMIIDSDNPCALAIADMVGWDTVTADAHVAGFTSTNISEDSISSTPSDTTLFLEKLAYGTLMDSTQTAALIGRMKQQIYRQGLPAGSNGATVADKVGFYGNYLHDAGVIYYPNSIYVISVFSDGGSWSQIANLASTISNYISTH